jgi:diguanylate cyclase (GGDEF)-like protein
MIKTLRGKFLLAYISLISVTIIFLSLVLGNLSIESSKDSIISYSFEIADLHADLISQKLDNHISALSLLANSDESRDFDLDYLRSHMMDLQNSYSYSFKKLAYTNNDTEIITTESIYQASFDVMGYFPENSSKYSRRYLITGPIMLRNSSESVIVISVPIYSRDNILSGVISGTITLSDLSKEVAKISRDDKYYGMITNQNGYLIAHPEYDYYDQINIKNLEQYGIFDFDDLANEVMTTPRGAGEFYDENEDEDGIYIYVSIPKTPNWKLGIIAEQGDLLETTYEHLLDLFLTGTAILIITILITINLTRRVTQPVITVTEAVSQSRLINITDVSFLKSSEELTIFVSTYNKMLVSLRKHTDNLEELVKERTTELKEANQKLHSLATTDSLTKIINRNQIYEELFSLKKSSDDNPPKPFCILFIDLNNFKYYNDTFGHDTGDIVLIEITKEIKKHIRPTDILGRYGGDEFIVILPNTPLSEAINISNKMIIESNKLKGYEKEIKEWTKRDIESIPDNKKLGLSIGYACYDNNYNNIDQLIKDADERMYQMKKESKKSS